MLSASSWLLYLWSHKSIFLVWLVGCWMQHTHHSLYEMSALHLFSNHFSVVQRLVEVFLSMVVTYDLKKHIGLMNFFPYYPRKKKLYVWVCFHEKDFVCCYKCSVDFFGFEILRVDSIGKNWVQITVFGTSIHFHLFLGLNNPEQQHFQHWDSQVALLEIFGRTPTSSLVLPIVFSVLLILATNIYLRDISNLAFLYTPAMVCISVT